ncbi:MAG TPA: DUF4129 domain-containing protein [Firmicutes bacterium]|nr:DUF4129 domain-containing protein [Bacillota bacterium]
MLTPRQESVSVMDDTGQKSKYAEQQLLFELVLIPLAAVTGAYGLALAMTRIVALLSGLRLGTAYYVSILPVALLAAWATVLCVLFNLPFTLRLADLAASYGITLLLLKAGGPITPGVIKYTETVHIVKADQVLLLTCTAAWALTSLLTHVVKHVIPWQRLMASNPDLARRLGEERFQRQVYRKKHAELATKRAWHTVYRSMSLLFAVMFIAAVFGKGAAIAGDTTLTWAGLIAAFGLLIYMALVQLTARNRLLELGTWVKAPSNYGAVWVQAALLPVLIAITLGVLLPADISPLTRIDGAKIGNWLGLMFYHSMRRDAFNHTLLDASPQRRPIMSGGGGGSAMSALITLAAYGIAIAFLIICMRSAWLLLTGERERARRMWRLLVAIVTLPLRLLPLFIASLFKRVRTLTADRINSRNKAAAAVGTHRRTGVKRPKRTLPNNLVFYIRYIYTRLLQEAAKGGLQRLRQETALEFAQRLAGSVPEAETAAQEITEVYCRVRYTTAHPPESWRSDVLRLFRRVAQDLRRKRRRRPH